MFHLWYFSSFLIGLEAKDVLRKGDNSKNLHKQLFLTNSNIAYSRFIYLRTINKC